jgi:N-acetylneuraminic acid mutarotase
MINRIMLLFFLIAGLIPSLQAQGTWTQIADMLLPVRCQAVAFSIGPFGYAAGGQESLSPPDFKVRKDFLRYDPGTNTWSSLPDLPQPITEAIVFTIGGKAFLTTGRDSLESLPIDKIYVWDTTTGIWEVQGILPESLKRIRAVGFSIGNKGYLATGLSAGKNQVLNDLWEYDPETDSWTEKASFPGSGRYDATCFVVEGKAYITNGATANPASNTSDMWAYDPVSDSWEQRASFPGGATRNGAVGLSSGQRGFIAGGISGDYGTWYTDSWLFDVHSNTWTDLGVCPYSPRMFAAGFTLNQYLYLLPGYWGHYADTWRFTPPPVAIEEVAPSISVYPIPAHDHMNIRFSDQIDEIRVFDLAGKGICTYPVNKSKSTIQLDVMPFENGVYLVHFIQDGVIIGRQKITILHP